ncbi:hypothetical protein BSKO_10680 [Bryopsis sp. KO-2023]|nr:hypothetical protein BSKO_10680 [Bryopsis sp. KO-2023]
MAEEQPPHWGDTPFIPPNEIILVRKISEGSFGAVFKAIYMYQLVAVKIFVNHNHTGSRSSLDGNGEDRVPLIRQMEQEVRILRNLRHHNVVGFLGAVEDPPAIVMDYCRSGSLWDVIRKAQMNENIRKKLSWTRRINLLLGAAQGMAFIHTRIGTKPVIHHRDLKSPNILLDKDWVVKIADFGLSRFMDPPLNIQWDVIANNPAWMAPEILRAGQSDRGLKFNEKTDVYPFGIIMWELLTLQRPWSSEDGSMMLVVQIFASLVISNERLPIPEDLASIPGVRGRIQALQAYIDLMNRCWASDQDERPTYKEIVVKLQDIKDLFMRRPPPCLDRAKTNEKLKEMLNLYRNPTGMPGQAIPMSDSFFVKMITGGQESGSFLGSSLINPPNVPSISGRIEGTDLNSMPMSCDGAVEDEVPFGSRDVPIQPPCAAPLPPPCFQEPSPFESQGPPPSSPPSPLPAIDEYHGHHAHEETFSKKFRSPFEIGDIQKKAQTQPKDDIAQFMEEREPLDGISPFGRSSNQRKAWPPCSEDFEDGQNGFDIAPGGRMDET